MPPRTPNLFIVGAPKCGTSALASYLAEHPQVYISEPKEPFFWSEDYPNLRKRHGIDCLERYLQLFQEAGLEQSCLGEGSTNYLRSEVAIPKILEFNPNAKFVVMLRNPIEVVHAFHSEVLFSHIENEPDFETAWQLQKSRRDGKNLPPNCEAPQFLQYADVADYAFQIQRFFDWVPEHQRRVIIYDDFKADNAQVYADTQIFLGLDVFHKDEFQRVNAAHGHRSQWLAKLVLDPPTPLRPLVQGLRRAARQYRGGLIDQLKHWFRKPMKRQPLSVDFHNELATHFHDNVERLSKLLDRDLMNWVAPKVTEEQAYQKETGGTQREESSKLQEIGS